jgi:hypothetical protein
MSDDAPAEGKWTGTAVNFLIGTVLATIVTSGFTYKSWSEQTRLDFAKEQLADARSIFDKASQLLSERIFSSYDVLLHINSDNDAAHAKRLDRQEKAIADWNLNYSDLLQHAQFALEISDDGKLLPYHEVASAHFAKLDCALKFDDRNGPAPGWQKSPSWLLAAIQHCFLEEGVQNGIAALRKQKSTPEREGKRDSLEKRLDNLSAHADNFRVASKSAIQRLRQSVETRSYLNFLTSW